MAFSLPAPASGASFLTANPFLSVEVAGPPDCIWPDGFWSYRNSLIPPCFCLWWIGDAPLGLFGSDYSSGWNQETAAFLDLAANLCSTRQTTTWAGKVVKWHHILVWSFKNSYSPSELFQMIWKTTNYSRGSCQSLFTSPNGVSAHNGELPHSHWPQQTPRECLVSREELRPRPETHTRRRQGHVF